MQDQTMPGLFDERERWSPSLRASGEAIQWNETKDWIASQARNDECGCGAWGSIMKQPCVYIMANKRNGTLYTGVTSSLSQRAYQHKAELTAGFTARYGCDLLVWYERYENMDDAIAREKQIKAGSRRKKLALIEAQNPNWRDLYEELNR